MKGRIVGLLYCLLNMGPVVVAPVPAAEAPPTYTNSLGMEFVLIPAGTFTMGSQSAHMEKAGPPHQVTISRPFYLGKTEVTQAQWQAVMGANPSRFQGPDRPVENVTWTDAQKFVRILNARENCLRYRLPTEAEWEYAARAGATTRYFFGNDDKELDDFAWYGGNSGGTTHPVAQKRPNPWGLYDIHGNVWELVQDWYGEYGASPELDPKGPATGKDRISRGGNWFYDSRLCGLSYRNNSPHSYKSGGIGLRLVRSMENDPENFRDYTQDEPPPKEAQEPVPPFSPGPAAETLEYKECGKACMVPFGECQAQSATSAEFAACGQAAQGCLRRCDQLESQRRACFPECRERHIRCEAACAGKTPHCRKRCIQAVTDCVAACSAPQSQGAARRQEAEAEQRRSDAARLAAEGGGGPCLRSCRDEESLCDAACRGDAGCRAKCGKNLGECRNKCDTEH